MRKWTLASFSVALILLLTTWCVNCQDLYEPNNQLGDATGIELNQTIGGSIFPDRDVDSYGFDLNSPGILKVILEGVPEDMKARIGLYGKNFNGITSKDASNAGDTVTLEIDIADPGRYYIIFSDLDGKSHDVEYSFKVTFEAVADSMEPNNQLGDATDINLDQTVSGYIFPARDADSYGFDLNSPGILKVILEGVPEDMKTRIGLYGKNFNGITNKDASNAGDTVTLEINIADPGRYYIIFFDLDGKSHDVEYSFKVTFEAVADSMEPNNQLGDATNINLDQTVSGYIFPARDADSYGFDLNSPGILKVILESVPEDMRTRIGLYGKNFNGITNKDASNAGDTVTLEIDIADPGRYYIVFSDLDGKSHDVEYSFRVVPESMSSAVTGNSGDATKQGVINTSIGSTGTGTSVGSAGSMAASYPEANLTHSGFDFSQGNIGEYPTQDGEIIGWQPGAATHPDYPRDSEYVWWRNTHLDDVNRSSQTKDMGEVNLSTVREVPAAWDQSPLIPPLLVGHTIVAKCSDGYVKFQVISIDFVDWTARVKYWYSPGTTFDDTIS